MRAEPCKLHSVLQLPAHLSLWLLWWECRKAVTLSGRLLSPVPSVVALSDGSCQVWCVMFLRSCGGGWSQWDLGLSQSNWFYWLGGCHLLVLRTGRSFLQRHHMGCVTVRKNLRSSVLSVKLSIESSTLLFLWTLYWECLTIFSSTLPSMLGAFWMSLQQNFLYCGSRQICSNRTVERIYL